MLTSQSQEFKPKALSKGNLLWDTAKQPCGTGTVCNTEGKQLKL